MYNRLTAIVLLCTAFCSNSFAQSPVNPLVYNGTVIALSDNTDNYVFARYLVANPVSDTCIQYSFSNSLNDIVRNFNCNEIGTNPISIWALSAGSMTSIQTETYTLVQDNFGVCPGSAGGQRPIVVCRNGLAFSLSGITDLTLTPDMWDLSTAACNNDPDIQLSFSADPADTVRVVGCDQLNLNIIQIWATSSTGHQNFAEVYYILQDNIDACAGFGDPYAPNPLATSGLAATPGYEGSVVLHAADVDAGSTPDTTTSLPLTFSFSADTTDVTRTFTCDDPGTWPIQIWVTDAFGRQNFVETFVLINDNASCDLQMTIPPNDNRADAVSLNPADPCAVFWSNVNATAEMNEPAPMPGNCGDPDTWCDSLGAEHTVWFQFEAPPSGSAELITAGMNTQMAVWELIGGDLVMVAANDDLPGNPEGAAGLTLSCLDAGSTYWVQIDGFAGAMGQFSISISDPNINCAVSGQNMALACGEKPVTPVHSSGSGAWQYLLDDTQTPVLAINDMGNALGMVSAEFMINGDTVRRDAAGNPYLDRNWVVSVENQPASPVLVKFFFGKNEWDNLKNTSGAPADPDALHATKITGASCGNYEEGGVLLMNMGAYAINPSGDLATTYQVDGFSAFYLHGGNALTKTNAAQSLPLTVYPNPAQNEIRIVGLPEAAEKVQISLTNPMGRKVLSAVLQSPNTKLVLPEFPAGLYLLQANDGRQAYSGKVLIIK